MANYQDKLKDVIQGEISALETYDQVINKLKDQSEVAQLKAIKEDHSNVLNTLKGHYQDKGDSAPSSSGAWGAVAKTVTGAANLGGEKSSLKALKEGEEHGIKDFNSLLSCDDIPADVSSFVRDIAIPNQNRHIQDLNTFIGTVE